MYMYIHIITVHVHVYLQSSAVYLYQSVCLGMLHVVEAYVRVPVRHTSNYNMYMYMQVSFRSGGGGARNYVQCKVVLI